MVDNTTVEVRTETRNRLERIKRERSFKSLEEVISFLLDDKE